MSGIMQSLINNVQPPAASSGPVTSGLVLWYDPSDSASYPGSGNTVYDLSGNELDGTMTSVSWTSPYFLFNWPTTNAYITIADNSLLEPGAGSFSIELWFSPGAQDGSQYILSKWGTPTNTFATLSYAVTRSFGTVAWPYWGSNGSVEQNTQVAMSADLWYQMVFILSRSPANLYTYVNGSLARTNSLSLGSINDIATPLYLGSLTGSSGFFAGRIGIVRLYNRALSGAEITTNWNTNRSLYGL